MSDVTIPISGATTESGALRRSIDWKGAFWVASGVPALVLFSIGGISGLVGNLAFLIWTFSVGMGFIQSFTYAEIAGLFPNKSGGASVYGAAAWVRYSKFIAPLSVWCNWLAWTPVLSLGCSIAAAYVLNAFFPIPAATSPQVAAWIAANGASIIGGHDAQVTAAVAALTPFVRSWSLFSHTLGPVSFSFGSTFFIGAVLMLIVFSIQHRGILGTANVQKYVGPARHHPAGHCGHRAALQRPRKLQQFFAFGAARDALRISTRQLERRRLDLCNGCHVPRRLVGLRVRDGNLLHL